MNNIIERLPKLRFQYEIKSSNNIQIIYLIINKYISKKSCFEYTFNSIEKKWIVNVNFQNFKEYNFNFEVKILKNLHNKYVLFIENKKGSPKTIFLSIKEDLLNIIKRGKDSKQLNHLIMNI